MNLMSFVNRMSLKSYYVNTVGCSSILQGTVILKFPTLTYGAVLHLFTELCWKRNLNWEADTTPKRLIRNHELLIKKKPR